MDIYSSTYDGVMIYTITRVLYPNKLWITNFKDFFSIFGIRRVVEQHPMLLTTHTINLIPYMEVALEKATYSCPWLKTGCGR